MRLTIEEKENCFVTVKKQLPDTNPTDIQDALFRVNWDVDAATELLKVKPYKRAMEQRKGSFKMCEFDVPEPMDQMNSMGMFAVQDYFDQV